MYGNGVREPRAGCRLLQQLQVRCKRALYGRLSLQGVWSRSPSEPHRDEPADGPCNPIHTHGKKCHPAPGYKNQEIISRGYPRLEGGTEPAGPDNTTECHNSHAENNRNPYTSGDQGPVSYTHLTLPTNREV